MKLKTGRVSLRTKLFAFVAVTSLLVLSAVGVGLYYYSKVEEANFMKEDVAKTVEKVLITRVAEKTFLQFYTAEFKSKFIDKVGEVDKGLEGLKQSTKNEDWKKYTGSMGGDFEAYKKIFDELIAIRNQHSTLKDEMVKPLRESEGLLQRVQTDIETKQAQLQMDGDTLTAREFGMLNVLKDCKTAFIQLQNIQLQFLISGEQKYLQEYKKLAEGNVQTYLTALEQFASALKNEGWIKTATNVRQSLAKFLEYIEQSQRMFQKESEKLKELNESGTKIVDTANLFLGQVNESIISQKNSAVRIISGILLLGVLFFWGLSIMLVRSITKPINKAIHGLTEVSEQVEAASDQVSVSSHELAEGASRQASAVEETSSSLEEMSSMTKQNAANAAQANRLMEEAKQTIMQANKSMEGLTASMGEISKASEQTQKIIKTIDEVAFQTNLLALNAAVEAARAGEAGAGFAVVADEVRNLARRAAEAAKNTAALIEATVKTVHEGAGLVERTDSEFNRVSQSVSKVGELVGEIAAASQEQSQGIDQVNKAVAEMDKVIQQNAANAEQSAAASTQMTSRAEQMKEFVADLGSLVGGHERSDYAEGPGQADGNGRKGFGARLAAHAPRLSRNAKEKIPMDSDEGEALFNEPGKDKTGEHPRYLHSL